MAYTLGKTARKLWDEIERWQERINYVVETMEMVKSFGEICKLYGIDERFKDLQEKVNQGYQRQHRIEKLAQKLNAIYDLFSLTARFKRRELENPRDDFDEEVSSIKGGDPELESLVKDMLRSIDLESLLKGLEEFEQIPEELEILYNHAKLLRASVFPPGFNREQFVNLLVRYTRLMGREIHGSEIDRDYEACYGKPPRSRVERHKFLRKVEEFTGFIVFERKVEDLYEIKKKG
jgi:hypothetical protein